jgi:hypothetical protein
VQLPKETKKTTNFIPSTLHQYQNYPPSIFTQVTTKPIFEQNKHKNYETIIYTSASSADKLQTPSKHKGLAWLGLAWLGLAWLGLAYSRF